MTITPEQKKRIEAIIATMNCPKDYACYRSDFQTMGRVRPVGGAGVIECLAEQGATCCYGLPFGTKVFCRCVLRKYILETFGR